MRLSYVPFRAISISLFRFFINLISSNLAVYSNLYKVKHSSVVIFFDDFNEGNKAFYKFPTI